jgi:flagellar biogenesis protein FliO
VLSKLAGVLRFAIVRLRRRSEKRLRLCENLALGDRRFVAVVQYEQTRFLLGGTASSLVVLARLGEPTEEVMEEKLGFHDDAQPQAGMQVGTHTAVKTNINIKDQL